MNDPRDDLVRRGDVMDELVKEYNRRWQEGGLKLAWIEKAVDSARPVAQPERKKGRWLTSDDMYETGVCSACKCDSQEPVSYAITMFKYCPNCGAKMEDE